MQRLEELAPRYFTVQPIDPYSGLWFRYRISRGEQISLPTIIVRPDGSGSHSGFEEATVAPGQGIVWSVGIDGQDQGGKAGGRFSWPGNVLDWDARGLDWIFVVPRPVP